MLMIYAPNVRSGGGLVLLQALLSGWEGSVELAAILDARARSQLQLPKSVVATWVNGGLGNRLLAEWHLRRLLRSDDVALCFHGLPPLLTGSRRTRVIVFLQNRLLVDGSSLRSYPSKTRVRLLIERWLLRWRARQVDEFIVQGTSMARDVHFALQLADEAAAIQVLPFADLRSWSIEGKPKQDFDFIYPSSGEPHKNHLRLIEAWEILGKQGHTPKLALTLGPADHALWRNLKTRVENAVLNVSNLGPLTHEETRHACSRAGALVFPSLRESFGLPLVETAAMGLPIIAGELDFVRDVCSPVQTFDPSSAVSIARAVARHLAVREDTPLISSPEGFWGHVMAGGVE